mmetsp:Transcript_63079/g.150343  ORF Transcript_63079/g.150343 Transcript_63079/m.150343 type:complete len:269 (+) Transcript_63079:384-1190(+)
MPTASSSVSTSKMESTGPKISSRIAGSWAERCSNRVGPNQKPLGSFGSDIHFLPSKSTVPPCFSHSDTYLEILAQAVSSITGPISPTAWPALSEAALSVSFLMKAFRSFPTMSKTLAAMQRCPAEPKAEFMMSLTVMSSSASGMAIRWFLAPPMQSALLPVARAVLSNNSATRELPTKESAAIAGCSASPLATTSVPCTIEKTPGGQPASARSSPIRISVRGTFSLGFMMRQFPQPMAIGKVHRGTIAGKLNGTIEATTPRGRRTSWQ